MDRCPGWPGRWRTSMIRCFSSWSVRNDGLYVSDAIVFPVPETHRYHSYANWTIATKWIVKSKKTKRLNSTKKIQNRKGLKGIGTSQTSKYVFGVFTYLSYRFHTHMNNRGAYYYRFDKILHLIQRAEASRGNVFYNELGDHVSRVEVYVLPAIGITC